MLKFTKFDIYRNLKAGDQVELALIRKNQTTKRFEAVNSKHLNKTEMILPFELPDQLANIESQIECLLNFQETNMEAFQQDPELSKALEESINFVNMKGEIYFDKSRIEKYFFSAKERKRNLNEPPELGGRIDKPLIKTKSWKNKIPEKTQFFYQDVHGFNIYLHYLCQEFLDEHFGLESAPDYIKASIIDISQASMNFKLRKQVKFLNHLPDNTEVRFVFVKLDDFLDKETLNQYIFKYQCLKKAEKVKQKRDEDRLNKIYSHTSKPHGKMSQDFQDEEELCLTQAGFGPKIRLADLETEESFERNKNNPDFYPSLKTEDPGGAQRKASQGHTNHHLANDAVKKILELEERFMQEKLKKLAEARAPVEPKELDEEEIDSQFQANMITIVKKPKKKKGRR